MTEQLGILHPDPVAKLEWLREALAEHPLHRSSMGSIELFHSNVLAWLADTHPQAIAPLVERWGAEPSEEYTVSREWRHLDLVLDGSNRESVLIENKVLAYPDAQQLRRHHGVVSRLKPYKDRPDDSQRYVLLSLIAPAGPVPEPWRRMSYGELAAALRPCLPLIPKGFDREYILNYADLCLLLDKLARRVSVDPGYATEPYLLDAARMSPLAQVGLADVALKLRNAELAGRLIAEAGIDPDELDVGFTNKSALITYDGPHRQVDGAGPVWFGWQFQGEQVRLTAKLSRGDLFGYGDELRDKREHVASTVLAEWFDRERISCALDGHTLPHTGRLDYCAYAPDFVYRYLKLSRTATAETVVRGLARLTWDVIHY